MSSTFHFFGIRHHGPACARSLLQVLTTLAPDCILIEGPPDAQALLTFLASAELVPPVALLVYAKEHHEDAVFYPFAAFSPEWQALRYGYQHGIPALFMDLPHSHRFALRQQMDGGATVEMEENQDTPPDDAPSTTLTASETQIPADPLNWLAQISGFADGEAFWNHWVEERQHSSDIFTAIHETMAELRQEYEATYPGEAQKPEDMLREAYMRKTMREAQKQGYQNIAVVCGAWHVPALATLPPAKDDQTLLKNLPKVKVDATWVPWTYPRLSRYSGYGAGISSPQWYHHLWHYAEHQDYGVRWFSKVAALFREKDLDCSSAHVIESCRLAGTLACLRGRQQPGLDELLEAAQTVMCMGDSTPLRLIHNHLIIGYAMGAIPQDAPSVPLQRDVEQWQKTLRLPPEALPKTIDLDLRKPQDLAKSELLHRLSLLGVDWGQRVNHSRQAKGTFHEHWTLQWQPELSIKLIEKSPYGSTVQEAASQYALAQLQQEQGLEHLADLIDQLLYANLPLALQGTLQRMDEVAALTQDVSQCLRAVPPLVHTLRYGNVRQTDSSQLRAILHNMVTRVYIGLPAACLALDDTAANQLLAETKRFSSALDVLLQELPELQADWQHCLKHLSVVGLVHRCLSGLAARLLFAQNLMPLDELEPLMALALSTGQTPEQVCQWLEGFLVDNAAALLHHDSLWRLLDQWLLQLPDEVFQNLLPMLRRAFVQFNPSERYQLAERAKQADTPVSASGAGQIPGDFDQERYVLPLPFLAKLLGRTLPVTEDSHHG